MSSISIGNVHLANPVLLAPMAGYTDLAFRLSVRELGAPGLACTEMLNPKSYLVGNNKKVANLLASSPEDTPLAHQIYGHEPEVMAEGAQWLQEHGAKLIDINMGCPQKKIARRGSGAGLLRDLPNAIAVARRTVESVRIPVTAKIRLGWDANDAAVPLAKELVQAGVAAITVHARTAKQGFSGLADRDAVRQIVEAIPEIPIIGNGDITSTADAVAMRTQTGCAAVMIGRYALKCPWIVRDAALAFTGQAPIGPPSHTEHIAFMQKHLDRITTQYGEGPGGVLFRRWIPQYARSLPIHRDEMIRILRLDCLKTLKESIARL